MRPRQALYFDPPRNALVLFDIATGKVTGRHYKRRRRIVFLDFINRIVKSHPGR
jgi:hypothetical protein